MTPLTRSEFLRLLALGGAGSAVLSACGGDWRTGGPPGTAPAARDARLSPSPAGATRRRTVAVARGGSPSANTERAVAGIGGMDAFVHAGDTVVVKPNVLRPRAPQYAATTDPEVVGTVVRLAREAGARRVLVMDNPIGGSPRVNFEVTGIGPAVEDAGGVLHVMSDAGYRRYRIPGHVLGTHPLYTAVVDADVVVNVPIAKQHSSTGLTLAGKNMMGACADRARMHELGLSRTIAELNAALRPELTVLDATRILVRNGPSGGDLADVERKDTVVASADWVAVDAWATRLFGRTPSFVPYIAAAAAMGLGTDDLSQVDLVDV